VEGALNVSSSPSNEAPFEQTKKISLTEGELETLVIALDCWGYDEHGDYKPDDDTATALAKIREAWETCS
jgi:hypothetical protein